MLCEKVNSYKDLRVKPNLKFFNPISDRDFWENSLKLTLEYFEEASKIFDSKNRKMLTTSLYRLHHINGDRITYEDIYFDRRAELINKVVLECYYNDDRYTEDIVDLLWMILEETTWILPAHIHRSDDSDSLPTTKTDYIDLFSAETACALAFAYQVLGKKLDEISVNINLYIKERLRKMFEVFVERDDFYWMGFGDSVPANWDPWICSNILTSCFIVEDDTELLKKVVYKALRCLDNYYYVQPLDGACDEGSNYWCQAGLCLLENCWILDYGTDGQINILNDEKIKNILEFFMKMYTGNGTAVNFADGKPMLPTYYATIYKMGIVSDNKKVVAFAKNLYDTISLDKEPGIPVEKRLANILIREGLAKAHRVYDIIKFSPELEELEPSGFKPDSDYYLEGTQVVTSRKDSDPLDGLFLAAKGGHNGEHHNHNDVGNFIVYKNGTKFLIDSGVMTYRKETFNEFRYTLWTTRGSHHNIPVIDGREQQESRRGEFPAKDVRFEKTDDRVFFTLDISAPYQCENVKKWVRSIEYVKSAQVITVTEDFEFGKESEYSLNFMTPQIAEKNGNTVKFTAENGETLEITTSIDMGFDVEKIESDDALIVRNWGGILYRVSLKSKAQSGKITYTIK